jgi:hypothetical protein
MPPRPPTSRPAVCSEASEDSVLTNRACELEEIHAHDRVPFVPQLPPGYGGVYGSVFGRVAGLEPAGHVVWLIRAVQPAGYRVCNQGPCTATELADLEVLDFQMCAAQLASLGPKKLRDLLLRIAALADRLAEAVVPDEAVKTAAACRGR